MSDLKMPTTLTPAMRAAAERVQAPITVNDTPFLDALYAAFVEAVRKEQQPRGRHEANPALLGAHAHDVATAGLKTR